MTRLTCYPASSTQVFAIPELMALICDHINRADRVRLLRVSKLLFGCVVPFVWRNISGVAQVMTLIPGTEVAQRPWGRRFYDPEALEIETTICLPKFLGLTRLRIYAPYIRNLEVSELPHKLYRVKGDWSVFGSTTKPGLLPNLHSLSITSTSEIAGTRDEVNWLSLFLCSSLRSIRMTSWYSHRRLWLDIERFSTFLPDVIRCCPLLETFEMYPEVGRPRNYRNITSLNRVSPNDDHACAPEMLQHYITPIPNTTFPALRRLELHHLDTRVILYLCALEPLVRRLTSIVIEFPECDGADIWDFERRGRSHSVVCSLGRLAPHIADLAVYAPGLQAQFLLDIFIVEALGNLPLQSLVLPEILLAPGIQWKNVLGALAGVQVLRLRCSVEYHELEAFATCLPQLSVLELRMIEFMQPDHTGFGRFGGIREVGVSVRLEGEVYIEGTRDDVMREAARYLDSLWPGLKCANRVKDSACNFQTVRVLNHYLSKIRAPEHAICV